MADFADSNLVALRYFPETTWGVEASSETMQALNYSSESLKSNVQTVTSETIRSDRNVSDITPVGGGAGGDVGFELRYGDIDELIAGAMLNDWVSARVSTAVASAYFSGTTVTISDQVHNGAYQVGQFFRVSNATTSGNDGDFRVSAVTSVDVSTVTLSLATASSGADIAFAGEVFGASTKLQGNNIRNGTTKKSYTIEKSFSDVSTTAVYTGMRVTSMALNFESQSILSGSFGFTGKTQTTASATIASAVAAAATTDIMNASGNVGSVWEGGQAVTGVCFQTLSIDLNNNPREQACVGSDTLQGVGLGRCEITGNITAYFENNALIDKFTSNTKSNFRFQVTDNAGNSYIVDVPRVTYTDFTIAAGGGNQDIVQDGTWGASVDSSGSYAIQITSLEG